MSRMLWIVGALASLVVAFIALTWMIQGAWLASFPGRNGEMNPPMSLRAVIFLAGLFGTVWMTHRVIRK